MSFYNKDKEIIDFTIDSDYDSSPPPPSPKLFQRFNFNSSTFSSKVDNDVVNYKYKMMTRRPRKFIDEDMPRQGEGNHEALLCMIM